MKEFGFKKCKFDKLNSIKIIKFGASKNLNRRIFISVSFFVTQVTQPPKPNSNVTSRPQQPFPSISFVFRRHQA